MNIDVTLKNVVGLPTLYRGRTTKVRLRLLEFLKDTTKGLMLAYIHRTSYKFQWQRYAFNNDQRTALIDFLTVNNLIEAYSRGFSFNDEIFKDTEIYPSRTIFDKVNLTQTPCNKTIIKCGNTIHKKNDNDAKILSKYCKRLIDSVNVPLIDFKRIYSGNSESGGRIYSTYQGMRQRDRVELIRIDGKEVTELDFRNNHLNILLSCFGREATGDDLYSIMDDFYLDRDEVKRAISAILNSERPISTLTSPFGKFHWETTLATIFLDRFYHEFPELERVKMGSELGLSLQKFEGDVMIGIINELGSDDIILPVHDSVICQKSKAEKMESLMHQVWLQHIESNKSKITGFTK